MAPSLNVSKGHRFRCLLEEGGWRRDQDAEGIDGEGNGGEGVPLPSRLEGLGERRKLPQRGPGPDENWFWCILSLKEPMW